MFELDASEAMQGGIELEGTVRGGGSFVQIKALIPVRVQRSFADAGGLGLLAIDGRDGKRIGKPCCGQAMGTERQTRRRGCVKTY